MPDTLQALVTQQWTWQGDSASVDINFLTKWLGLFRGITPEWAHFILKPYVLCQSKGCYHSTISQDMFNWMQSWRRLMLLPPMGGALSSSSFAPLIGLAAQLSYLAGHPAQPTTLLVSSNAATSAPAGTSALGAQPSLATWLAELAELATASAKHPAVLSAPMEVNNTPVVNTMGDYGMDTSDIYQGSDELPSV